MVHRDIFKFHQRGPHAYYVKLLLLFLLLLQGESIYYCTRYTLIQ